MYATLFTFVGRNLINSSMRGKKYITRWIRQTITRVSVPSSPNTAFQSSSLVCMIPIWSTYIVGGKGYWRRSFHRLVHMGVWCSASTFSVLLIYRDVKRNKLQICYYIVLVEQSCFVLLLLFTLKNIIPVQLRVAGAGPTIEWSYLPRKIVREKRLSLRGHGDCILLY